MTPIHLSSPVFGHPSERCPAPPSRVEESQERDRMRHEAELAQREREQAKKDQSHLQLRACGVPLGSVPNHAERFSFLWAHVGPRIWTEAPIAWQSLIQQLWRCWAVSSALLLGDLLFTMMLWLAKLARWREVLIAIVLLLTVPACSWFAWLLPICHFAHEKPEPPPYNGAPGGWSAILALAAHVLFCGLAALGPQGCGLPGFLVCYDALSRQHVILGLACAASGIGWTAMTTIGLRLYHSLVRSIRLEIFASAPGALPHAGSSLLSKGGTTECPFVGNNKKPIAYGRI
mmetsp:Transcript_24329/g.36382  ORF Transcript_24329/g.36382 Transcript_24329/m.36382 type:complete len:289 (+) Transcript_24329:2-868(+)